jgi:hypothetical protein
VPLVAAAVCPHPPILVPELAAGAAAELEALRLACDRAIDRVLSAGPTTLVLVGGAAQPGRWTLPVRGSFAPWGVAFDFELGSETIDAAPTRLPVSLLLGAWLLRRCARPLPADVKLVAVPAGAPPGDCAALGESFGESTDPVGLLVMGDGSACRSEKAPGFLDPRAEEFDTVVRKALAAADPAALLALDPALGDELMAAGRAPWQVLAGAAGRKTFQGEVLYHDAPYGVSYTVAVWR